MLLALFDGTIGWIEKARAAKARCEELDFRRARAQAKIMIVALAAGVRRENNELADNFARLYEFCCWGLDQGTDPLLDGVYRVLCTLREGFEEVRPQAVDMERNGQMPPVDAVHAVRALA
jgi:hypothetical protein